ncbi:MAG: hypothetical protein GY827_04730 [Cytophagales bacterium]|nr:hypothetical protein [Cytophagales bacterium]
MRKGLFAIPFVLVFIFIIGGIGTSAYISLNTEETLTITVTDKDRITTSDVDGNVTSKYLVFTDNEVFENTDDLIHSKFNSHDFQAKLKVGETYKVVVVGLRIPVLSTTRNIVKIISNESVQKNI